MGCFVVAVVVAIVASDKSATVVRLRGGVGVEGRPQRLGKRRFDGR